MIRNTKVSTGLVLVTALLAMGVSGTASALPEMVVGSRVVAASDPNLQVQADDPSQVISEDGADLAAGDADTDSTSN